MTERIVHIVDDSVEFRLTSGRALEAAGYATTTYGSGPAFLAVAQLAHGCVLLDVQMPDMDGFAVQAELHRLGVCLPIILITGWGNIAMAVRGMKAGAVDFIEKPFTDEVLVTSVENALQEPLPVRVQVEAATERIATLTPRERVVLDGLVAGKRPKQIAYELHISVRTVEVHRVRMLVRLAVPNLATAIRLAVLAEVAERE
jgi:two-component system response regulator FixJ